MLRTLGALKSGQRRTGREELSKHVWNESWTRAMVVGVMGAVGPDQCVQWQNFKYF